MHQTMRLIFTLFGGLLGIPLAQSIEDYNLASFIFPDYPILASCVIYATVILCFAIIFFSIFPMVASLCQRFAMRVEESLEKIRILDLVSSLIGTILGLFLAMLISTAYNQIPYGWISLALSVPTYMLLGYLGFMIPYKRRDELSSIVGRIQKKEKSDTPRRQSKKGEPASTKLLDTSVIIDGRILDLVRTGFLEGVLVVPVYVLAELQTISDSADDLKRSKGRRGLDLLNLLQQEKQMKIIILEEDYEDIKEVDAKLIRTAKAKHWKILTNDFNLNKVATVQGIEVLNINDLSNALKPKVLPGEEMRISLIKSGKDPDQAVGYLEDGTMIVVENGKSQIGTQADVIVTSALQTSAGRMIFARLRHAPNSKHEGHKRDNAKS